MKSLSIKEHNKPNNDVQNHKIEGLHNTMTQHKNLFMRSILKTNVSMNQATRNIDMLYYK